MMEALEAVVTSLHERIEQLNSRITSLNGKLDKAKTALSRYYTDEICDTSIAEQALKEIGDD